MTLHVESVFTSPVRVGQEVSGISVIVDATHTTVTEWSGIYEGIRPEEETGELYHFFGVGIMGETPQRCFGSPVAQFTNSVESAVQLGLYHGRVAAEEWWASETGKRDPGAAFSIYCQVMGWMDGKGGLGNLEPLPRPDAADLCREQGLPTDATETVRAYGNAFRRALNETIAGCYSA